MADPRRTLILVNGPSAGAIGERARWIAVAAGGASVAYREGSRTAALRHFLARIRQVRPDVLYLVDCAVATVAAGVLARRILGARVVLDTGDAVAALTCSSGRGGRLGAAAARILERLGYRISSTIVVRSDGLAKHVKALSGRAAVLVPDGFDPTLAGPRVGGKYRASWKAGEHDLVVGVVGSARWNARLGWCYGRDVVEAVAHSARRDLVGAVVVRGDGVPRLRALADRLEVSDRVVFEEPADADGVWDQLGALDVALSTQTNDAVGNARTTGKLVQYLAAGKFILASRVGTAATLLPEDMLVDYHGAWDSGYFERLARRVDALPRRDEVRRRGMQLIHLARSFSYERLVSALQREVPEFHPE